MKTCTLLNPSSGIADRLRGQLVAAAAARDSQLVTLGPGAENAAWLADVGRRFDRLIVVGGDGTVGRVINLLGSRLRDVELALVPAGTGNDLARSVDLPLTDFEQAWRLALTQPARELDLVRMVIRTATPADRGRQLFANVAAGGFGGVVASHVRAVDKQRWGAFAYWIQAFSDLGEMLPYQLQLELDERTLELEVYGLGVCNGRFVGGGFPIAPTAQLNDGRLEVTAIPALPTMDLLAAGMHYVLGSENLGHRLETFQATRVTIHAEPDMPFSVDGEPAHAVDAMFQTIPRAMRFVCGRNPPALTTKPSLAQRTWGMLELEEKAEG